MEKKYYDNTPIIEYPLIVAELKQQLKAKDELIKEAIKLKEHQSVFMKTVEKIITQESAETARIQYLLNAINSFNTCIDIVTEDLEKSLKGE